MLPLSNNAWHKSGLKCEELENEEKGKNVGFRKAFHEILDGIFVLLKCGCIGTCEYVVFHFNKTLSNHAWHKSGLELEELENEEKGKM